MKVLVVDDDKLARKGLIAVMEWEKYGFRVEGDVQNGRKALEFLDSHDVDLVFTDIDMPEMDGLTLMQECKKRYPNVQFVIFSMYEDFRYAQTAIRMGALDYISKISFDVEECGKERLARSHRRMTACRRGMKKFSMILKTNGCPPCGCSMTTALPNFRKKQDS